MIENIKGVGVVSGSFDRNNLDHKNAQIRAVAAIVEL